MSPALTAALLALAGSVRSQQPTPLVDARSFLLPIHTHQGGDDAGYGTWASGPAFKASFHDGFAFYPLLGDQHADNLPLRWRTLAASVGGAPLELSATPVQERSSWRYEYRHPGLREIYDVRLDGVEQSFVVEHRPASAGDLQIRGRITSKLSAPPVAAAHQALQFQDGLGHGHVRYGEAFAVDANGDRVPATTAFDGQDVVLTVDGAWLKTAAFPVTVDPLTSAVVLSTTATLGAVATTDVGQEGESATHQVLVAMERAFSATDHDVYGFLCDLDFGNLVPVFSDVSTANDDRNVSVAFVAGADRWLLGFQRGYLLGGVPSCTIRVQFHGRGDTGFNSGVGVSLPQAAAQFWRSPDLGGTFLQSAGSTGLLVYTSDPQSTNDDNTQVLARPINAATAQFLPAYQVGTLLAGTTFDREAPSVNQTSANGEGWVIVWQELNRTLVGGTWTLQGTRTDAAGLKGSSAQLAAGGVGQSLVQPQVSGMNGVFLTTFLVSNDVNSSAGAELRALKVAWALTPALPALFTQRVVASAVPPITTLGNAGLAWNHFIGSTAVATWTLTTIAGNLTRSAYATRMGGTGVPVETQTLFASVGQSALAPSVTFAYPGENYPIVYGTNESSSSNFLYGRSYSYPITAGEFRYGTACGTGIIDGNRPYVGNENYRVGVGSAPANTALILLAAFASGTAPLDAVGMTGCVLNLDPAGILFVLSGAIGPTGYGSVAFPMPDLLPPVSGDIYFQCVYLNPGANPAGLQATQGLHSQFR